MNLLFVYNADSGLASALFDSAHKLLSPGTYQCHLCALTHGLAGPKREWSEFLKTMAVMPQFMHRDEFLKAHPSHAKTPLPAIFRSQENQLTLLVDGPALQRLGSLEELTRLVRE